MKIFPLEEKLAKADYELIQACQELEHTKAEQHIAWRKVGTLLEQQKSPIEVQYLSTELQEACTELRNAQNKLQNAMMEACEGITLQFTSNDEVRTHLGEAKVEAMASREYRPNHRRAIEKHRDFASQYGLVMKEYEKKLKEEKNNLSNIDKVIINLRKKLKENSSTVKMAECALKMTEREITTYKGKNRIINHDHNQSEKDCEASSQAKELLETRLEPTKQELEEVKNQLEDAGSQLQEKLKERNNFSSFLTKKTEERKQQEILLAKAEKERKAIAEQCEKAKKAMKNLDKFLEDLR
jgi:chromosome segregation ATPase